MYFSFVPSQFYLCYAARAYCHKCLAGQSEEKMYSQLVGKSHNFKLFRFDGRDGRFPFQFANISIYNIYTWMNVVRAYMPALLPRASPKRCVCYVFTAHSVGSWFCCEFVQSVTHSTQTHLPRFIHVPCPFLLRRFRRLLLFLHFWEITTPRSASVTYACVFVLLSKLHRIRGMSAKK